MKILGLIFAVLAILMGLRMAFIAVRTAVTGRIVVRRGLRSHWERLPNRDEAWGYALRDAIFGILLIILGVAMIM